MSEYLLDRLVRDHHEGRHSGVASVCSAHPLVLDEAVRHGAEREGDVLIEATCNQVNQDGGYTGLTPSQFRSQVLATADRHGLTRSRLTLGGDHLGPNPWRHLPTARAMGKADELVRSFVAAGYSKIHLDASMKCGDDDADRPLPVHEIAARTARLAAVAEQVARDTEPEILPRYVIGTEVPVPGGGQSDAEGIHVTSTDDLAETISLAEAAFRSLGLGDAWSRVRCVVAQPGVEFSDTELYEFDPSAAAALPSFIEGHESLVFEAHSTDYQSAQSLRALVEDHFAVLKVGPGLTFAYREGVFALSTIEDQLLRTRSSDVRGVLENAMVADPTYWQGYYPSEPAAAALARQFSRSDRSRYYWPVARVVEAVDSMVNNLRRVSVPEELLSQYLPVQYARVRAHELTNDPIDLLRDKIREVLDLYAGATGG